MTSGNARVNVTTGDLEFTVHGLVFAGGNVIGSPAPVNQVKGSLICDLNGSSNGGNSTVVSTPAVELSATGDAHFNGNLGALPAVCRTGHIAFLVRAAAFNGSPVANGPWIANGAVLVR